jgi:molybdate transport system substrate-binding protein
MFEQEFGTTVHVVYGPSKTLRRQIEKGEPIDVFFPDGVEEVENLYKKGLTLNGKPRVYAQTSLVLVMSAASPAIPISFHDVLRERGIRIAVGDPNASALGDITARALTNLDGASRKRVHLVYAEHTGDILNLVRTEAADVGIVYRAAALNGGQLRIIEEAPGETMVPFGAAVVWTCRKASRPVAQEFLDFIMSTRIQKLFLHYGFEAVSLNGTPAGVQSN